MNNCLFFLQILCWRVNNFNFFIMLMLLTYQFRFDCCLGLISGFNCCLGLIVGFDYDFDLICVLLLRGLILILIWH